MGFPLEGNHLAQGHGQGIGGASVIRRAGAIAAAPILELHAIRGDRFEYPGIGLLHDKVLPVLVPVAPSSKSRSIPSDGGLVDIGVAGLEPQGHRRHRGSNIERIISDPIQVGVTRGHFRGEAESRVSHGTGGCSVRVIPAADEGGIGFPAGPRDRVAQDRRAGVAGSSRTSHIGMGGRRLDSIAGTGRGPIKSKPFAVHGIKGERGRAGSGRVG